MIVVGNLLLGTGGLAWIPGSMLAGGCTTPALLFCPGACCARAATGLTAHPAAKYKSNPLVRRICCILCRVCLPTKFDRVELRVRMRLRGA